MPIHPDNAMSFFGCEPSWAGTVVCFNPDGKIEYRSRILVLWNKIGVGRPNTRQFDREVRALKREFHENIRRISMSVMVLGSINADITAYGDALPRIGETVLGKSYEVELGGKGANQAAAAARLGAKVEFVGRVGRDAFGKLALDRLGAFGVSTKHTTKDATAPDRHRHHRRRCAGAKRHHGRPRSQYAHRRGAARARPPALRACQSPDAAARNPDRDVPCRRARGAGARRKSWFLIRHRPRRRPCPRSSTA